MRCAWTSLVRHALRVARLRRIWGHLGQFLQGIKAAGRVADQQLGGTSAAQPAAEPPCSQDGAIDGWAHIVAGACRVARLRRIWGHLGQYLKGVKAAGRLDN